MRFQMLVTQHAFLDHLFNVDALLEDLLMDTNANNVDLMKFKTQIILIIVLNIQDAHKTHIDLEEIVPVVVDAIFAPFHR